MSVEAEHSEVAPVEEVGGVVDEEEAVGAALDVGGRQQLPVDFSQSPDNIQEKFSAHGRLFSFSIPWISSQLELEDFLDAILVHSLVLYSVGPRGIDGILDSCEDVIAGADEDDFVVAAGGHAHDGLSGAGIAGLLEEDGGLVESSGEVGGDDEVVAEGEHLFVEANEEELADGGAFLAGVQDEGRAGESELKSSVFVLGFDVIFVAKVSEKMLKSFEISF